MWINPQLKVVPNNLLLFEQHVRKYSVGQLFLNFSDLK